MPRRNRPVSLRRLKAGRRARIVAAEPARTYQAMARDLVERGLASPLILGTRRPPTTRSDS